MASLTPKSCVTCITIDHKAKQGVSLAEQGVSLINWIVYCEGCIRECKKLGWECSDAKKLLKQLQALHAKKTEQKILASRLAPILQERRTQEKKKELQIKINKINGILQFGRTPDRERLETYRDKLLRDLQFLNTGGDVVRWEGQDLIFPKAPTNLKPKALRRRRKSRKKSRKKSNRRRRKKKSKKRRKKSKNGRKGSPKYERCVKKVKARQPKKCKESKWQAPGCYNPWAVCTAKVGRNA